jgi:hypothetical protein
MAEQTALPRIADKSHDLVGGLTEKSNNMEAWLKNRRTQRAAGDAISSLVMPIGSPTLIAPLAEVTLIQVAPAGGASLAPPRVRASMIAKPSQHVDDVLSQISPIASPRDGISIDQVRSALIDPVGGLSNLHIEPETVQDNSGNQPKSYYKEYFEQQKKRDEAFKLQKQDEERLAAARRAEDEAKAKALQAITEVDEEEDGSDDEFDTGAAASALMRMRELHQQAALGRPQKQPVANTGKRDSKLNPATNKKASVSSASKRGSTSRKNSEAANTTDILGADLLTRKNSKAVNTVPEFAGRKNSKAVNAIPEFTASPPPGSKSSKGGPPARSKGTVLKRFGESNTELKAELNEKEKEAKVALQARLEARNKAMLEALNEAKKKEGGWK